MQHTAIKWTKHKWHKACRRLAWWTIQMKRPPALVNDPSFKEFCCEISSGKFESCCLQTITKHVLEMSAIGSHEVSRRVVLLVKAMVNPSTAADIWSDSTISLIASTLYFIDEDWTQICEVLLNCTGSTGEKNWTLWNLHSTISMQR